jgi:hypothetical protein
VRFLGDSFGRIYETSELETGYLPSGLSNLPEVYLAREPLLEGVQTENEAQRPAATDINSSLGSSGPGEGSGEQSKAGIGVISSEESSKNDNNTLEVKASRMVVESASVVKPLAEQDTVQGSPTIKGCE